MPLQPRGEKAKAARRTERERAYQRAYGLERRKRLRQAALDALGRHCALCGFADERALQIDHKNGSGTQEKKSIGYTGVLRRSVEHPEEYQILCANCNWIKRAEQNEHQIPIG